MAKVKLNHNGSYRIADSNVVYAFEMDKPTEVSGEHVAELEKAFGKDLEVVDKNSKSEASSNDQHDQKEVKAAPNDKMVKKSENK